MSVGERLAVLLIGSLLVLVVLTECAPQLQRVMAVLAALAAAAAVLRLLDRRAR